MLIKNLSNFVAKYLSFLETLLIVSTTVSMYLLYQVVTNSQYAVWISLGLLAAVYWLMAMRPFETKVAGIRIAIRRLVYLAYTFGALSIMAALSFNDEVNAKPLEIATLAFLGVSVVLLVIKRVKLKEPEKFFEHLIRCFCFAIVITWLLIMEIF